MQSEPQMNFFFWFGLFLFRSPLLQESSFLSFPVGTQMFQFPTFPSIHYFTHVQITSLFSLVEFPHSDIHGSRNICFSPWLFAAYHVFLRLLVPRHSPYALSSLTFLSLILITSCLVYLISSIYFSMCFLANSKLRIAVLNFVIIFSIYISIISKILPRFPCTTRL